MGPPETRRHLLNSAVTSVLPHVALLLWCETFTVLFPPQSPCVDGLVVGMITVLTGPQLKEIATSGEWSHSPVASPVQERDPHL